MPSAFGIALKDYRLKARLSQTELAKMAGISGQAIAQYESGLIKEPSAAKVKLLAAALQIDANALLSKLGSGVEPFIPGDAAKKQVVEWLLEVDAKIHEIIKAFRALE